MVHIVILLQFLDHGPKTWLRAAPVGTSALKDWTGTKANDGKLELLFISGMQLFSWSADFLFVIQKSAIENWKTLYV